LIKDNTSLWLCHL